MDKQFYKGLLFFIVLLGCAYEEEKIPQSQATPLRINEVVSNNCTGLFDAFGKTSDWVELYNRSTEPINLSQFYLSDDSENPMKWQLGDKILSPKAYEVVHLSGENFRDTGLTPERIEIGIQAAHGSVDKGLSFFESFEFDTIFKKYSDSSIEVSARMYLGDNVKSIGWKGDVSISISLNVGKESTGDKYVNIDDYNQIELTGYFEEGKQFLLGFGLDSWGDGNNEGLVFYSGLQLSFIGTGNPKDTYILQLNKSESDNLLEMDELKFIQLSHTHIGDTAHFTLRKVHLSSTIGNFHSNFKISSDGDELYLSDVNGVIVDSLLVPSLRPDVAYGLDEIGGLRYFDIPTPGSKNSDEQFYTDTVPAVQVAKSGGFFTDSVFVAFTKQADADVRYTIDGSIPSVNSPKYDKPFLLKETATVRVAAFKNGSLSSAVSTETYFINERTSLPVVSITVDPEQMFDSTTGMYMVGPDASPNFPFFGGNFWDPDRMLDAHLELFEESRIRAFSRPFGLKIHGGWSRGEPKKSLAMLFKDQYNHGDLAYPIFPEYPDARRFKSLILRMGGGHSKDVMIYDGFNSYLTKGRNIEYQKMRSVKLFINGKYWGLYNIREKLNEHYFTTNFALDGAQINMVKDGGVIQQGSIAEYVTIMNFLRVNDVTYTHNYDYVRSQLDIDNYIDYMASEMFIVNTDWPANNLKWWKSNEPNSKWRWIMYDTDDVLGDTIIDTVNNIDSLRYQYDMMEFCTDNTDGKIYPNGPDYTFLFRKLLMNDAFKKRFINRAMTLHNTNFTTATYLEKLTYLLSFIGDEYKRDFDRWGLEESDWGEKVERMKDFARERPRYYRSHFRKYFSLEASVEVTLGTERGELFVDGMSVGSSLTGRYFPDVTLSLTLSDTIGFKEWSDGDTSVQREYTPVSGQEITAIFE